MKTYLAIDVGTSSLKACLYAQDGRQLASSSADYTVYYSHSGWAEQNPDDWWRAAGKTCQPVLKGQEVKSLRAVCLSGQAPLCVPVDRHGRPLRPAISWLDRRAGPQVAWLKEVLGLEAAARIGGNTLDSYFGGPKWLWFKQNEPDLYARTWKILQASSYVMLHLSGKTAVDPSLAGLCSPCFNLYSREWDVPTLDLMELDLDKLPPILPSSSLVGQVSREAAESTGIPAGTPVVCGGGDYACACLGAGVLERGTAAMMLGTAGNLLVPTPQRADPRLFNTVHVSGELLSLGGVLAGGAVRWFSEMLGMEGADGASRLDAEAAQVPAGAEGLVFLPYLLGERTPIWDPLARGVFIGLSTSHRRGHIYRAVLEGVALAFRQMVEIYAQASTPIRDVVAINGGARSALWRQIFADVLGLPIRWRPHSGGTSLGAAFLAALGVGDAASFSDLAGWLEPTQDTLPDPRNEAVYQRHYRVYCQLYGRLKDMFLELTQNNPL